MPSMPSKGDTLNRLFNPLPPGPEPGSKEENELFEKYQKGIFYQYEHIFPDKNAPRTVVIVPSLTLDMELFSRIKGAVHYEERLLCLLMLLRMPRTKVVYISSIPFSDVIIDYYLHLLQGITGHHARKRLTMLSCNDLSQKPLTEKILNRPRLISKIKELITDPASTHLTCYNITPLEKTLAVRLGIPLFGTDPSMFYLGSKSGARITFRECGIDLPDGMENLENKKDVAEALAKLRQKYPGLRKCVIKMNDGFSGEGNAMYRYPEFGNGEDMEQKILATLDECTKPVAKNMSCDEFYAKFTEMQGIVEIFLEGEIKTSPSVQCVIGAKENVRIDSTHDQLLGGDDGQTYMGAVFPADEAYAPALAEAGRKVALALSKKGALGRFAIDFISVRQDDGSWKHYAIEINLRKGGTTHPFMMMQFLTNGKYEDETGAYITASGNKRYYFASDNLQSDKYKGLAPDELIELSMYHGIMYDGAMQEGTVFHLMGALSEFGKLGAVSIGSTPERAKMFYDRTIEVLDLECS